jgi:UDP-glucose 4-epimerase
MTSTRNKILVTGGCGYIGSHTIIELLTRTSYEVISCDSLINSSADALCRIEKITGKTIKNYETDLCDEAATARIFQENPDLAGVIHFAALKSVPESVAEPLLYYHNNITSLVNLLKVCNRYGVNDFIFSSSCSVYGNVSQLPVHEGTVLSPPESPYAATKQMGEQILADAAKAVPALRVVALRYFNPVGAHLSGHIGENPTNPPTSLVPIITQTAAGLRPQMTVHGGDYHTRDGSCIRDYIHVSDIADAHVVALQYLVNQKNTTNYEVFNLGTGNGVSVLEAIHAFQTSTGVKLNYQVGPRRAGDVVSIYSDTTRTASVLGWQPRYGISEMMESAWKWQMTLKAESTETPA